MATKDTANKNKTVVTTRKDGSKSVRKGSGFVTNLPSATNRKAPTTATPTGKKVHPVVKKAPKLAPLKERVEQATSSRNVSLLHELSLDPHTKVRCAVARNPKTSEPDLLRLLQDESDEVRLETAISGSFDWYYIDKLIKNAFEPIVGRDASKIIDLDALLLEGFASNWNTRGDSLHLLAGHKNANVRRAVAENEHTDEEDLNLLARSKNEEIEVAVADNQFTNPNTLEFMVRSKKVSAAGSVAALYALDHLSER